MTVMHGFGSEAGVEDMRGVFISAVRVRYVIKKYSSLVSSFNKG